MALLEINLEKPALVEEYQYPKQTPKTPAEAADRFESTGDGSSGGVKGKLVGLLAVLAGVGVLAWKLKSRGSGEEADIGETDSEHGPEPEIGGDESGGAKGKVAGLLGLAVAVVGLAVAVQKRRQ